MAKRRFNRDTSGNVAESPDRTGSAASRNVRQAAGRHRPDGEPLSAGIRTAAARVTAALATAVTVAAAIACVILAIAIAFAVFGANEGNAIVRTVGDWGHGLAWQFRDMFTPKDHRVYVLVNYGIAAVVYLIAGRIVAGLLRRVR
jgi:hypothetical protein